MGGEPGTVLFPAAAPKAASLGEEGALSHRTLSEASGVPPKPVRGHPPRDPPHNTCRTDFRFFFAFSRRF